MVTDLELVAGGRPLRFPAAWLRDNCPCRQCRDPGTGQKLIDVTGMPNGLAITLIEDAGQSVRVTFGPEQHRSVFSRAWLAAHALDGDGAAGGDGRTEDDKELWLPADLDLPAMSWPRYLAGGKAQALRAVLRLGFVLLRDVPAEPGRVLDVAASFGYVRETNYGRLFDVRVEPAPGNLAYTSRAIRPHTDNPYRDPAPTVQLLHCLRAAGEGGDTGLVDGFAAAAAFRAADAESFATLAKTPVRSVMPIKRPNYGPACRSSSSARGAGFARSGSTTGRCGRCSGHMPRSPRSTPPTGGGLSCSRGRNGGSTCG
jgi:gamma-butyrobetaine dioxygenase